MCVMEDVVACMRTKMKYTLRVERLESRHNVICDESVDLHELQRAVGHASEEMII